MAPLHTVPAALARFACEEEGSQVIEYALIIAVVSIALVLALQAMTANGGAFSNFINRVQTCLTSTTCS